MSNICIAVMKKVDSLDELKNRVCPLIKSYELGVFFDVECDSWEIKKYFNDEYTLISLADSERFDNCEMLILDDWSNANGHENELSFSKRMEQIRSVIDILLDFDEEVHLYIGYCGAAEEDYERYDFVLSDFVRKAQILNTKYYSRHPKDVHFAITRD